MSPNPRRLTASLPALAVLVLMSATGASAQDDAPHDVVIRIVDAVTTGPLPGVAVWYTDRDRAYTTGEDGTVVIPKVKGRFLHLDLTLLGYVDSRATIDLSEAEGQQTISLAPRPVVLEGIAVTTDRLESRRKAAPASVRVFDRERLLNSPAFDVVDFVRMHGALRPSACSRRGRSSILNQGGFEPRWGSIGNCSMVRGGVQQLSVVIDERTGSLGELSLLRPDEVYELEIYGGGRQIRVYTNWFMELVASGRARLMPVIY